MTTRASAIFVLAVGLLAGASAAAPGPVKPPPQPKNVQAYLDASDKCQDGPLDLLDILGGTAPEWAEIRKSVDLPSRADLELYQACEAGATGRAEACDALGGLEGGPEDCRELKGFGAFVWAVFNGGDALTACQRFTTRSDVEISRAGRKNGGGRRNKLAQKCEMVVAAVQTGRTEGLCQKFKAAGLDGPDKPIKECERKMVLIEGVPARCDTLADKIDQFFCREEAALLTAVRSRDFRACAASPWCVALSSRKPETCEPYLLRAKKSFCDHIAVNADPLRRAEAAAAAKVRAQDKQSLVYHKGEPMQMTSPKLKKAMKQIEGGTPPPQGSGDAPTKEGP